MAIRDAYALNSYHYVSGNTLQARDPVGLQEPDAGAPTPPPDEVRTAASIVAGQVTVSVVAIAPAKPAHNGAIAVSIAATGPHADQLHVLQIRTRGERVTGPSGTHSANGSRASSGSGFADEIRLNTPTVDSGRAPTDDHGGFGMRTMDGRITFTSPYYDLSNTSSSRRMSHGSGGAPSTVDIGILDAPGDTGPNGTTTATEDARATDPAATDIEVQQEFTSYIVRDDGPNAPGHGPPRDRDVLAAVHWSVTERYHIDANGNAALIDRRYNIGTVTPASGLPAADRAAVNSFYREWSGSVRDDHSGAPEPTPWSTGETRSE